MSQSDLNNNRPSKKQGYNNYVYYTGLGFQMIATIGLFAFIGYKIDVNKAGEVGLYTAILSLIGVCVSLVGTIYAVTKKNK
ncbi:AtpZ/AtpI family protein [Olivibacter sp. SDN3]|nr:AtpZ/AtpI family protein [Olivibacter sp. SDN3]QNL50033.1 AtpZ/AtpI family protein [Olivibacter sp. SDN3]